MGESSAVGVLDRRRARDGRDVAGASAPRGDRLPPPPRERRPLLAALAVLLIVGGAAVAGLLALRLDERVQVVVAAHDIANGSQLTADDFTTTAVASEGTLLIPAGQLDQVVGQYARVPIAAGQLLDTTMLSASGALQPGLVAVGAGLAAGRMPASGLQPGDVVELVRVGDGTGTVLVPDAYVSSSSTGSEDQLGSGGTVVTFIVDESEGAEVAAVAADGSLAAVLVSRGDARG
ncbi:SAF domain-containing protein [Actinotalea sp. M2MS4P-6]|uniref:SAF domain-containing protein n=1 Tax=Actinotalea sp. M2MS4P-6 TaxID=2983762 RepID=UPI0021E479BF|nr:SAF domain-containing protein [Actinotalea sp. M2MS4P-6]MCV2394542.1 SAF domain-containing protein [Actinotalea sp. M2MS4P-6]